jgi:hypothetical protein
MSQARFSVQSAVSAGFAFWRANVLEVAGPLVIGIVALTAITTAGNALIELVAWIVYGLSGSVAAAACYRVSLVEAAPRLKGQQGPFGLQFRALELRLVAIGAMTAFRFAPVVLLAGGTLDYVFARFSLASAISASPDGFFNVMSPAGQAAFIAIAVSTLGVLLMLDAALALAAPSTAVDGKLRFLSSLKATRGAVLRILFATLVIRAPLIALQSLATFYVDLAQAPETMHWIQLGIGIISTAFYLPISVGMMSYIYLRLREGDAQ